MKGVFGFDCVPFFRLSNCFHLLSVWCRQVRNRRRDVARSPRLELLRRGESVRGDYPFLRLILVLVGNCM